MSDMLDAMIKARDALTEYYRDDAPVVALRSHAIVDAEGYDRAYELLFKEHGKLRSEVESFQCIGVIDSEGGIYPEPPEAGTQVFVKTPNVNSA